MNGRFGNCAYRFDGTNGKPIYAPSEAGRKLGKQLKKKVERRYEPDEFYYHLRRGGHVAAIHVHRKKKYFARLDLGNFFYSISRNRVARALRELEIAGGERYAKWSTVKNEFAPPNYALPYGFVQSPILASLVLARSPLGEYLREIAGKVVVSVYVDDIAISGNNKRVLQRTYRKLIRKVAVSNFIINDDKSAEPGLSIELFNCHLERMRSVVTAERRQQFYSVARDAESVAAFENYCRAIEQGNQV
jgi:hypothetical protein